MNTKVYQVIKCDSREPFDPYVSGPKSKEEAEELFNSFIEEVDNDDFFKKVIDKKEHSVKLLCNHRGWGPDYIISVTIQHHYIH